MPFTFCLPFTGNGHMFRCVASQPLPYLATFPAGSRHQRYERKPVKQFELLERLYR